MKNLLMLGSLYAFLGVALGAFGAHALNKRLIQLDTLTVYHTGVQYHMIHALALVFLALLYDKLQDKRKVEICGGLFAVGILIFSGSLYLYSVTGIRILGAITPLGGLCFLSAWLLLAVTAVRE